MARFLCFAMTVFVHACSAQSPDGRDCMNPTLPMVAQTQVGSGVMKMLMVMPQLNTTQHSTVSQNISSSFDYKKMSWRQSIVQSVKVEGSPDPEIRQEIKMIMNWASRFMTTFSNMSGFNTTCQTIKLPRLLPPAWVEAKVMESLLKLNKCSGHHDDVDEFSMHFPPRWLPFRVPMDLEVDVSMTADKDGVIKSESLYEHVKTNAADTNMSMTLNFTQSHLGGPSEEELRVPPEWGNCRTINDSPSLEALLSYWEGPHSPFHGHLRVIPHALRAMLLEQTSEIVV